MSFRMVALAVAACAASAASAADQLAFASPDRAFSFVGGIGYAFLRGDEIVYEEENRISHLIWESHTPVINARFDAELRGAWTISGGAVLGAGGNSNMEDFDWVGPFHQGYAFDDWTHRSQHADTRLHRYIDLDVALKRSFTLRDDTTVSLLGGFRYTNVHWTGSGGSLIYSDTDYRADIDNFPPGEKIISFEQRYPAFFLGAEAARTVGAWTFNGSLRGGLTISATDTDHHWLRDIRFEDEYGTTPFVSVSAGVAYSVTERIDLFVSGRFDRFFHVQGDANLYSIATGSPGPILTDGAGMKLSSATVLTGLSLAF